VISHAIKRNFFPYKLWFLSGLIIQCSLAKQKEKKDENLAIMTPQLRHTFNELK
jgi:hypothetical protein